MYRCRQHTVTLAVWLLFSGIAAAQDSPSATSQPELSIQDTLGIQLRLASPLISAAAQDDRVPQQVVRRVTLQQAQQLAAGTTNPLVRLGQLQVEAAEQHRLGVKSLYFPNVSTQFESLHFNKTLGEVLSVQRPFAGTVLSVPTNVIEQNQNAVNVTVVQPITPIFAVRQLVKVARADERIARAKAEGPVTQQAGLIEKSYFELLIAERELAGAGAAARKVQATLVTVSNPGVGTISTEQQMDTMSVAKSVLLAAGRVKELRASLNEMLGLPADTRLELVPPDPLVENLSLKDVNAGASASSAAIIEAEQTAVKAHAGSKLARMEYFPSVAVLGGATYQDAINAVLPQQFAYVGVFATYTLFDSFKRERGLKEASLQAQAADLGVELTKAKMAAAVKTSYFELERSRELVQLARRMASATRVVNASVVSDSQEIDPAQAGIEAELFRAELEYRQAYARVKSFIGDR